MPVLRTHASVRHRVSPTGFARTASVLGFIVALGCASDPESSGDSGSSGASTSTGVATTDGASTSGSGSGGSASGTTAETTSGSTSSGDTGTTGSTGADDSGSSESSSTGGMQVDPADWDCGFVQTAIPGGSAGDMVVRSNDDEVIAVGFEGEGPRGLHLERFDHDGVSLAQTLVVDAAGQFQFRLTPRAAWSGTTWGIVYGTRSNSNSDALARLAIVGEDGSLLAGPVNLAGSRVYDVQIVWTGEEFAILWLDSTRNLWFSRVDAQGTTLAEPSVLQSLPSSVRSNAISMVHAGNELGLAWTRSGEVEFQRLSLDGTALTQPTSVLDDALSPPALLWRGDRYTAVAIVQPAADERTVQLFELGANGVPMGDPIDLMDAEHREHNNSYAAHSLGLADQGLELGLTFLATRDDDLSPEVYFQRVAYDGELVGDELRISASNANYGSIDPSLVWTGSGYLAAWRGNSEASGWDAWVRSVCP